MKHVMLLAACCVLVAGCAKVRAQSSTGLPRQDYWGALVIPDGKPPRWVPTRCINPPGRSFYDPTGKTCVVVGDEGHWECDKGYVLDGFKVEWPSGVAKISPLRCKAEAR